jgi:hypothetical protein
MEQQQPGKRNAELYERFGNIVCGDELRDFKLYLIPP